MKVRQIIAVGIIILGGFVIVAGGYDDSPGAQLIGVAMLIGGGVAVVRGRKKV